MGGRTRWRGERKGRGLGSPVEIRGGGRGTGGEGGKGGRGGGGRDATGTGRRG